MHVKPFVSRLRLSFTFRFSFKMSSNPTEWLIIFWLEIFLGCFSDIKQTKFLKSNQSASKLKIECSGDIKHPYWRKLEIVYQKWSADILWWLMFLLTTQQWHATKKPFCKEMMRDGKWSHQKQHSDTDHACPNSAPVCPSPLRHAPSHEFEGPEGGTEKKMGSIAP